MRRILKRAHFFGGDNADFKNGATVGTVDDILAMNLHNVNPYGIRNFQF